MAEAAGVERERVTGAELARRVASVVPLREVIGAVAVALGAVLLLVPVLRLDNADARVPFYYGLRGDGSFYAMTVNSIAEDGDMATVSRLGAPDGLDLRDFPLSADNLSFGIVRALSWLSSDWALLVNAFFVLTFALAAASAFAVLRALGVTAPIASAAALLFAFAPFHFSRNESHLLLSAYYGVPLGAWLVVESMREARPDPLFPRLSRRALAARALAVIVIGSTGIYFAAFTIALLVTAAVLLLVRRARAARAPLLAAGAIFVVLTFNVAPTIAYWVQHGTNSGAITRVPADSERLGLRLADLVLPVSGHRFAPFAAVRAEYNDAVRGAGLPPERTEPAALGAIGAIGFLGLIATAAAASFGGRQSRAEPHYRRLAVATLAAFFIGAAGGVGSLFAVLISPTLRGWNRVSIFILFFALAGVALALDWLLPRLVRAAALTPAKVAVASVLTVVGVADQASPVWRPDYASAALRFQQERDFVRAIEAEMPRGAAILQLPYDPFPESPPPGAMRDYDHLAGYLHSKNLSWTYGAMEGRPQDWTNALRDHPVPVAIAAAASAGFEGVYVDWAGYTSSEEVASVDASIREATGDEPAMGVDGRLAFFDLRDYREQLEEAVPEELDEIGELVLHPVMIEPGRGVYVREEDSLGSWRWTQRDATIVLRNPLRRSRDVVVEFTLSTTEAGQPVTVRFRGEEHTYAPQTEEVVAQTVELRPGTNLIEFSTDAPEITPPGDARSLAIRIGDFRVADIGLLELVTTDVEEPAAGAAESSEAA